MCRFDEYPPETEIITFDIHAEKGVAGYAPDGIIVFTDYNSHTEIKYGEKWHCRIILNKKSGRNYFAWPIEKIDYQAHGTEDVTDNTASENTARDTCISFDTHEDTKDETVIVFGDILYSKIFTAEKYSVYRSINGEYLQIIPDPEGNVTCKKNMIILEELENMLSDVGFLKYAYGDGTILVKLEA